LRIDIDYTENFEVQSGCDEQSIEDIDSNSELIQIDLRKLISDEFDPMNKVVEDLLSQGNTV
jgi:hypothetical protein